MKNFGISTLFIIKSISLFILVCCIMYGGLSDLENLMNFNLSRKGSIGGFIKKMENSLG